MIQWRDHNIRTSRFPDGTLKMNVQPDTEYVSFIDWYYENDGEFFVLATLVDKIRSYDIHATIQLFLSYVPNARMDRAKEMSDCFTLKTFANLINQMKLDTVVLFDPHSYVAEALFDRVVIRFPDKLHQHSIDSVNSDIIFFPDEGAYKRYTSSPWITKSGKEFGFGIKDRDWKTGQIKGYKVVADDVAGKNILIIDDICSRGGTFYHSAKALKELGAGDISLCVTHSEKTMFEGDMYKSDMIKKIYTTNSLPYDRETLDNLKKVVEIKI